MAPAIFEHVPRSEARAAALALAAGLALMGVKFVAYFLTGSAAIFSDALESIVNVAAAAFALYSLYYAHRPADEDHPYGHGKIEFLAAGFEGGMILLAGAVAAVKAVDTFVRGSEIQSQRLNLGLLLIAGALVVNASLGWHLLRTGRRQGSLTLIADGRHLLSDALTSVAALVGLGLVRFTGARWPDAAAALIVAAYIAWVGVGLLRHSLAGLLDQQDAEDERLLRQILDAHIARDEPGAPAPREPALCGYHKLRHRHSGRYHWVDFHIHVPAGWDVERGHCVATAIEDEIQRALGEGNATAHVEPCRAPACARCAAPARGRADSDSTGNRDAPATGSIAAPSASPPAAVR